MTFRSFARVSATGLLAAGALAAAATPALAAEVDFSLTLKGTTIGVGVPEKPATVSIGNLGHSTPAKVLVRFDARDLNTAVDLNLSSDSSCKLVERVAECYLPTGDIPDANETADFALPFSIDQNDPLPNPASNFGKLTISVVVAGDVNPANDSKTVDVVLSQKRAADLRVVAPDVTKLDADGFPTGEPLAPGDLSLAYAYVFNHGNADATDIEFDLKLPQNVTFHAPGGDCEYDADLTAASCKVPGVNLVPYDQDGSDDKSGSAFVYAFMVYVSDQVTGPAALGGGSWTAAAKTSIVAPGARKARKAVQLPEAGRTLTPEQVKQLDVDASDNTDTFAAIVGGPEGGEGGGNGDDDGPTLPVTGPVAATAAGAGVAVLAAGTFLFIAARRRRIVFTSADGK